jgi:hypothetical protein
MRWVPSGDNTRDFHERGRLGVYSPLADPRGRQGRSRAIRDAILAAGPWPDPPPVRDDAPAGSVPLERGRTRLVDVDPDWPEALAWITREQDRLAAYRRAARFVPPAEEAGQGRLF